MSPLRGALLGLFGLGALLGADVLRSSAHETRRDAQTHEDVYYLPPASWLPTLSLGYREALADLLWLRALVYFGEELGHQSEARHVFEYAEAIEVLDPDFRAVYRWLGMAGFYRPGVISAEDAERAIRLMERGSRRFPDDGELAFNVGAALAFELPALLEESAERERARERGAPYLMAAARLGAGPEWMALSNASLLARVGRAEMAARHLEEMYLSVRDEAVREEIAERIRSLRERARAEAFVERSRALEEGRARDFPYLSPTLYLLVGPRPPVDIDGPISEGLPAALAGPSPAP